MGIQQLNGGKIELFGKDLSTFRNGMPGRLIGYMPQETCLYESFTILETFIYYGRLYCMPSDKIVCNLATLKTVMNLPSLNSNVNNISGGERRRVSLGVALLHDPQILILDEPCVGIDRVLRQGIWDYLERLVKSKGTTVFLTTHYVQETRQCAKIGYLRDGRMLVQESPNALLEKYGPNSELNANALDDIMLHFCKTQVSPTRNIITHCRPKLSKMENALNQKVQLLKVGVVEALSNVEPFEETLQSKVSNLCEHSKNYYSQLKALTIWNLIVYIRYPLLPLSQLVCFLVNIYLILYTVGNDPIGLNLGTITDRPCDKMSDQSLATKDYACQYLNILEKSQINVVPMDSEFDALQAIKMGSIKGYLKFPENFTQNVLKRLVWNVHADEEIVNGSAILIQLDNSEYMNSYFVTKSLYESMQKLMKEIATEYGIDERKVTIPLSFHTVYGNLSDTWNTFFVPMLLLIMWMLLSATMGFLHVTDTYDGTLTRTMATGVDFHKVLLSYYIADIPLTIIQAGLFILCVWWDRGDKIKGSWALIGLVLYLVRIPTIGFYLTLAALKISVKDTIMAGISILQIYLYASVSEGGSARAIRNWIHFGPSRLSCGGTAINLVSGSKSYSDKVILDRVDITVEKGTIYALLGPSGCGKTTLLSCIVGVQQLNEGKIELFGRNVSTFKNGMPGGLVGCMPQETCLYESFTILETFIYYGRLYCMPLDKIICNLANLKTIMDLPSLKSYVNNIRLDTYEMATC
ncbi:ABC transporter G family member 23 [Folsomia candida]|uniref:ABC transporter G family member 23 n=1 Tax=Folsomia candida TaxID=158441 RepID=UPI001605241A|nr:ABC transporter G family member 23 [Folsomia candida]